MDTFLIETPRLILREFVPEDLAGLYRLYEESDTRYIEPLAKDSEEELEKLKSYIHYIYGFYGFGLWAVCLKESGELIGRCGFQIELIGDEGEYELGYMISGRYTGCGYASEAVRAVLEYAREELKASRVVVRIHKDNRASLAFAKREGFYPMDINPEANDEFYVFVYDL